MRGYLRVKKIKQKKPREGKKGNSTEKKPEIHAIMDLT